MKLTFKDLKQQKFVVEAEPSETIGQVKEKISKEKGWEPSLQKLIYSAIQSGVFTSESKLRLFYNTGKILQDANTVESYNIEEKGFIVCMVSKPKVAPGSSSAASPSVKAPSTPTPGPAQTPAPPPAPVAAQSTSSSNIPSTPSPAPAAPGGAATEGGNFNDPSALALGSERAAAISNMESMGFPRAEIDRAMRAAFNNPDRAVEYLLTGIPESFQQEEQAARQAPRRAGGASGAVAVPQTDAPIPGSTEITGDGGDEPINLFEAAAQAGRSGSGGRGAGRQGTGNVPGLEGLTAPGAGTGAGAGGLGNLDFLRNNPQFQQLRQIVQTQPRMLEPILQQVGAGNPQLAQLIGQNPDQFLQLLSEDADEDAPLPPGAQAVSVTEEEREAIERLCRLGFDRDLAIQAYFACDKNEELAANFLFEQPPEEGED